MVAGSASRFGNGMFWARLARRAGSSAAPARGWDVDEDEDGPALATVPAAALVPDRLVTEARTALAGPVVLDSPVARSTCSERSESPPAPTKSNSVPVRTGSS